jgi:hypothetical protein
VPNPPQSERDLFREALKPDSDCPRIEDLEALLNRRAPEELARHVEHCAHCRSELEMLRSFHSNDVPAGDAAAVRAIAERLAANSPQIFGGTSAEPLWQRMFPAQWFTGAWLRPMALAGAGLLMVGGIAIQLRHDVTPPLSPLTDPGKEVFRSSTIAVLAPLGDVSEAPLEIKWEAAPAAARYRVRLLEVDRTELWQTGVSATSAAIPPEIRTRIIPLKTLLWEVTAFDSAGRKIAQSELARFRFSRKIYTP